MGKPGQRGMDAFSLGIIFSMFLLLAGPNDSTTHTHTRTRPLSLQYRTWEKRVRLDSPLYRGVNVQSQLAGSSLKKVWKVPQQLLLALCA